MLYRGLLCGFVEKGLKFLLCFRGSFGRNFKIVMLIDLAEK
ncbi:hypothetical protein LEP1GSC062_3535 [Leptospira alexanderi serovar Manhao 3 str. L 60]|uniref:Uncharacterized protein n=1 Tax=Leptospira alexanderi serovar Manhao 3 str. L 60 TaxID=1049759 RepID=V6I7A7_9LEPT|nr:hypothetical protein LEP1GSC062_3535 [Leptospira alexanderi serovar Manhao 3 str. L 60]